MDIEVNPGPEPSKKGLSMVHMNIQSLYMASITNHKRVKIDEIISTFVVDKPTDIICLSETWLHDQISNKLIEIPGYHEPERNDRKDRQGGGVCAYISENIVKKRLTEIEPPDIDLLWIELKLANKRVIMGVGYRPPRQSKAEVEQFMDQFTSSLNKAINLGAESLVILGDFNDRCTKWDSTHDLSDLKNDFYDLIQVSDLVQLVNEPTHIGPTSESLIDLVITDSPGYVNSVDLLPPIGSRHATVYVDFAISYQRDKNYMRKVWDYDKGDYDQLNEAIFNYPWEEVLHPDFDVNQKSETLTSTYLQLCSENIPNRVIKVKPRDLPWITHDCKCLIRSRNRLYNRFKRTRKIEHETIWKNKAREVRASLNLARLQYRQKMMAALSDPNLAAKKYWSLVKRIYGSKKGMGIPVLEVGSKNLSTSTDKANAFTDFFKTQQTLIEPIGHSLPNLEMLTDERLSNVSTTPGEVKHILDSLELGKAHGGDGVSVRMLRETSSSINGPLSTLINDSLSKGIVPTVWKRANISPVHKKNSRSVVSNYRPISLLSTLAKVQERIVFKRMYRFLSSNGLLTPKNSGFKEKDSAICQLINIVDRIYKALESGKDVSMVFLDISKAFDKVWHRGLLHKLKCNGIDGSLLLWLEDYLKDREIRVVINGQCASWASTNAGVPQGSILGPLLFLVFINDVVDNIESDINLFADDTSLMNVIEQLQDSYDTTNEDLIKLAAWANQWLVTYNATKTVSLHITMRNELTIHPALFLNGTQVNEVESHCHLGVDIENTFTWQSHIKRIASKGNKCVGLMRRASRDLPRSCLEKLYLTMVRPILEYGGVLFDNSPDLHLKPLDKVQREAALVCTGAYRHTKTVNLMKELGWDTLGTRRELQRTCLMYKIQNKIAPLYLISACPPLVREISTYNLRNAENISLPAGKRTGYVNSFMPNSVRLWNNLDRSIKSRTSIDSFKYHLKKKKCIKGNKLYSKFNGRKAINHTRIRLGLSGLKAQRHDYNHVPVSTCDHCGARKEDAMHYLLQCNAFNNMRTDMLNKVKALYQSKNIVLDLSRTIVKKQLVDCLLKGDKRLSECENVKLFAVVQDFISSSKRF
jgi:hypothetical protein